jgi:hypothetical protein
MRPLSPYIATGRVIAGAEGGTRTPTRLPHTPLKRARLPVPPLRHEVKPLEGCGHYSRNDFNERRRVICSRLLLLATLVARYRYLLAAGDAAGAAGDVAGAGGACCAGVGVAVGALAGADCNTDREPVKIGKPSANAINMNAAAAPIVIFANRLAVPRGPNAVLDSELEKSAPASALPGCSRITTTRMMHERMNSP